MNKPDVSAAKIDNSSSFDAFKALTAKIVQVPKAEADKKETAYQRAQKKKPKRGPQPN